MPYAGAVTSQMPENVQFSHCDVSPWIIASHEFNENPLPLHIQGVRETNRNLFAELDEIDDALARGQHFHDYVSVKFALHHWNEFKGNSSKCLRNSYIRFLCGWGVNSSSAEGAVLKSWAQSRFGIFPTFHQKPLGDMRQDEDLTFARDRLRGSRFTNAIDAQLDLLYEFCQYELSRQYPDRNRARLYRGTYDPEEHPVLELEGKRKTCVRLNNVCSFTSEKERAWEFGSTVWETDVPFSKIIFFSGLLPDNLLQGEDEHIVLGGEYWTSTLLY